MTALRDLLAAMVHQVRVGDLVPCYHGERGSCESVADDMLATPSGEALDQAVASKAALEHALRGLVEAVDYGGPNQFAEARKAARAALDAEGAAP